MKKGLWGKLLDACLIVALFYAVFVFGKCKGYSEGQIQGYMIGYESFIKKRMNIVLTNWINCLIDSVFLSCLIFL